MKGIMNLTVRRKIFLSCFLIVFLFLLIGLYFMYPINKIRGAAREIESGSFAKELRDEAILDLSSVLGRIDYLGVRLIKIYFLLIFFTACASLIIAFIISGKIASPIKELALAISQLEKGNFDYKINIKSKDEFGILQEGVMIMAQRLKHLTSDLYRQKGFLISEANERTKDFEQTKRYLEEITNGIDEEIILLDKDYKILWVNKKVYDKIGSEPKDIIGQSYLEISLNNICAVKELLNAQEPVTVVHSHHDKQGNLFYAEMSVYPLKNEQGEIIQIIHKSRDITKRIEMESELNRSVQEMKDKISELELFHRVTIGRELKMVELKERIVELEQKLK